MRQKYHSPVNGDYEDGDDDDEDHYGSYFDYRDNEAANNESNDGAYNHSI